MIKKLKNIKNKKRIVITLILIIIITVVLVFLLRNQRHFYRRSIREIEIGIRSLGNFAPIAVVLLTSISTIIPPLPLPVPLIEIASGLVFGFGYGFVINWVSLIVSSFIAYFFAKHLGKRILKRFSKYKFLDFYTNYLKKSGAYAVFITRAALISPFNIVSFLAGLTEMKLTSFMIATTLGTIPEAALYSFIGSIIRKTRLSLGYVFALVIIVGAIGLIATFIMIEVNNLREEKTQKLTNK